MHKRDLGDVTGVADWVHPAHPEDWGVFAERLALYPDGCLVLDGPAGIDGYVISHPWTSGRLPKLNTLLGALPDPADTYYLHDIAILNRARGTGAAKRAVDAITAHARSRGFAGVTLVAVNNSANFWRARGFRSISQPGLGSALASYGGDAVLMQYPF